MTAFRRRFMACLVFPAGLLCCSELKETPEPAAGDVPSPEQEAWGWSTVVTRSGRPRAAVVAEHVIKSGPSEAMILDGGVTVYFFGSAGEDTVSRLWSDRARIDEGDDRLVAIGHVILTSRDSTRLETDTLIWSRKSDLITGGGRVLIRRPDGEETGVGFEATSDLKRWSMREVTTRLTRPDALP